ncbi:MAG: formate--tetrahydrofolate ligase [Sneathiellaceae bacterium]
MAQPERDQHRTQLTDLEIAQAHHALPIAEVAARAGIPDEALLPYGRDKAKLSAGHLAGLRDRPDGRLILVTAITPTPAGEGKTTTTIGLGDGLNAIGHRTVIALREPSLGPCFGVKGGATGGGYAQVVPMEEINLHFTGDLHAIGAANNLLAALVDNHMYWGNALGLDPLRLTWRRCLDINDRALRGIVMGLGGPSGGIPREGGFDITVASEVMAVFCLASDLADLQARLGRMVVGRDRDKRLVTAAELQAEGAMAALLATALQPNLVQTLEGNPALVHGGPFANIAHGCNSLIATRAALKMADFVVTEAGFGADLGAQKFFDIKCRIGGLAPDAVVLVATIRALKMHGGLARDALGGEDVAALERGFANLARHVGNLRKYGVPALVAINRFSGDSPAERERLKALCAAEGVEAVESDHWARGGAGATELAQRVAEIASSGSAAFRPLYPDEMPLADKLRTIAREIYGAADIALEPAAARALEELQAGGFGHLPVCVAKTQSSLSADPALKGAPTGHVVPVREIRLSAGAGFVVAICGTIMTMPGLPRRPAAERIGLDADGRITGLS